MNFSARLNRIQGIPGSVESEQVSCQINRDRKNLS